MNDPEKKQAGSEAALAPDSRHVVVTLGDAKFKVPKLNLGQQRRLFAMEAARPELADTDGLMAYGFGVAKITLERAEPPVGEIEDLECTLDDLREATSAVHAFSGLTAPRTAETAP